MKKTLAIFAVFAANTSGVFAAAVPAELFGQNIEHTRSAVQGGLSAELVRNRKFAGKPSPVGVAAMWEACGAKAVYQMPDYGCTRHAAKSKMFRMNEIHSQLIGSLDEAGEAGIVQRGIGLRGGVSHTFRIRASSLHDEDVTFVLRVASGGRNIAEHEAAVRTKSPKEFVRIEFSFTPEQDCEAEVSICVKGRQYGVVGAVSVMPDDNFRGMRADVVRHLQEIGASYIRWPGGNFAGEYRWRDSLIADRDERAPLQSYTEIETQPYSFGYDSNDIGMEDVIALCERIGAKPIFTINAVWETPESSVDWLKACKGRVKMWSLGNEMGYGHMEGPKGPEGYVKMVRPHAEAMLREDPSITLVQSGLYPWGGKKWIDGAATKLADVSQICSYHRYEHPGVFDFSTPERTAAFYASVSKCADKAIDRLGDFRAKLPREIAISCDEWNIWETWYHEEGIIEGLYTAKFLTRLMRDWERLGIGLVCYFQAINEKAIVVSPFESHLSSAGEAMRLWKGHVGGIPSVQDDQDAFVTDHSDGSRYVTMYNFSTVRPHTFRIPTGGQAAMCSGELLVPTGLSSGSRYARRPLEVAAADGFVEITLPPASIAAARMNLKEATGEMK